MVEKVSDSREYELDLRAAAASRQAGASHRRVHLRLLRVQHIHELALYFQPNPNLTSSFHGLDWTKQRWAAQKI